MERSEQEDLAKDLQGIIERVELIRSLVEGDTDTLLWLKNEVWSRSHRITEDMERITDLLKNLT